MKKDGMVRMCCGCGRIRSEGRWRRALAAVPVERITHGFCDRCFVKTMAVVMNHRRPDRGPRVAA